MSLVPDYEDSSSDLDSSSEEVVSSAAVTSIQPPKHDKLPTPGFLSTPGAEKETDLPTTSVFTNPFIEAEIAKRTILERHVKMVNTNESTVVINGKKICWNYRKGRCRFGHNCKYAHDSDLQKTQEQLEVENQTQRTVVCQTSEVTQPSSVELDKIREDAISTKKRKRPGLTQGLIPGKKVMKNYIKQQKLT